MNAMFSTSMNRLLKLGSENLSLVSIVALLKSFTRIFKLYGNSQNSPIINQATNISKVFDKASAT